MVVFNGLFGINSFFPENVSVFQSGLGLQSQVVRRKFFAESEVVFGLQLGLVQVSFLQAALGLQSVVVHVVQFVYFLFFVRCQTSEILDFVSSKAVESHLDVNVTHFHCDFCFESLVAAFRTRIEALFVKVKCLFLLVDLFLLFSQFFVDFDELLRNLFRVSEGNSGNLFGLLEDLDGVLEVAKSLQTGGQSQVRLDQKVAQLVFVEFSC